MPKKSYGETCIATWLQHNKIRFEPQFSIKNATIRRLKFDFYLPKFNTLIEFDGRQHFKRSRKWHRKAGSWAASKKRDVSKSKAAVESGYRLLRISHLELKSIPKILQKWCKKPKLFRFTNRDLYRIHLKALIQCSEIFKSKLTSKYSDFL